MARDPDKDYVVTAPYVTMAVMTSEGKRVVGFGPGATVPGDVTEEQFDHHLANGLIAAVGEAPMTIGPTAQQLAQQARDQVAGARIQFADAQARLDNALAAKDAADAAVLAEQAKADARSGDQEAAQHRVAQRAGDEAPDAKARPLRGAAKAAADKAAADKAGG